MKANDLLKKGGLMSILAYGPAGTGKTALFSQAKDCYMLDFDGGMRTAATLNDKFKELRLKVEFDTFVDFAPRTPRAWKLAKDKLFSMSKESSMGKLKYKSIVVDSLTGMARAIHLSTMGNSGNPFAVPKIQHWGTMVNEMEIFLTIARTLKCLLLVTAHEMPLDVDGQDLIRPMSVTKKHSLNKLAWLFNEVWHSSVRQMGAGRQNYIISGRSTSCIMARTRSGLTDDLVHNEIGLAGVLEKIGYSY